MDLTDRYSAFGTTMRANNPVVSSPFGFGAQFGYYTDSETGLTLCGQRFYDPGTGRWINRDPIGYAGGQNLYAYAGNNPVMQSDPSGLDPGDDDLWYDRLAKSTSYGVEQQKQIINDYYATSGAGVAVAPVLTSAFDFVGGTLCLPSQIGHYGEGAGAFAGDPTPCNAEGLMRDIATTGSIALALLGSGEESEPPNCFVAGTPVQMADGTTKPVEQVRAGDWVVSRDQYADPNDAVVAARVVRPMHHEHPNAHMVTVTVSSGEQFTCTDDHPFYVPNRGWVMAGQLSIGTQIVPRAGPTPRQTMMAGSVVTRLERFPAGVMAAKAGTTTVYTVEVEGTHTYFVGTTNGGTWVHNDCLPGKGTLAEIMEGSGYRPGQYSVNASKINSTAQAMLADPVGFWQNMKEPMSGDDFGVITSGHNRFVASQISGVPVPADIIQKGTMYTRRPISWQDVWVWP